jgi:hypothetical protein
VTADTYGDIDGLRRHVLDADTVALLLGKLGDEDPIFGFSTLDATTELTKYGAFSVL